MLYEQYGHCIIPAGTWLFRGGSSAQYDACMFFGLLKCTGAAFQQHSADVQVWEVRQDFKVLFMVLELSKQSWAKSAIVDIYKKYHSTDSGGLDDLDIKHFDHQKRDNFIQKLKDEKIIGWLSSVEDKIDLELCLFPERCESRRIIELHKVVDSNDDDFDHENALNKIGIVPSPQFWERCQKRLEGSSFERYMEMFEEWMQEYITQGMTEDQARIHLMNLRTKLRI